MPGSAPEGQPARAAHRSAAGALLREPAPLAFLAARPSYPWLVVGTVCIGAFMGQLDASIAQLVLPTLETEFHARLSLVDWVALAYLLGLAASLPVFGRLADMFGRKLLYTSGFALFVIGSTLCGFASTLIVLIGARAFQAIGAAMLQANSVAIITAVAGPGLRGRAIGVQGAAQAVGLSIGPAVGGLLIQSLGWRWVFWINVPAGLAGLLLGWLVLPRTEGLRPDQRFDWWGALLLAPALTALLLVVNEARQWGVTSPALLGCAIGGVLLTTVFVRHERSIDSPLVDFALFRVRAFTAGNLSGLLSYGILFGVFFLLPFALERGRGESPLTAGLLLTAVPVALGIVAPLSGGLSDRIGARSLTIAGMLLAALALVLLALTVQAATLVPAIIALALFGVGEGLFTAPNNSAIMGAASLDRLGVAGGLLNVMRSMGTSLGVAIAATFLSWRLAIDAGHPVSTAQVARPILLTGTRDALLLLAALGLLAAFISLERGHVPRRPGAGLHLDTGV